MIGKQNQHIIYEIIRNYLNTIYDQELKPMVHAMQYTIPRKVRSVKVRVDRESFLTRCPEEKATFCFLATDVMPSA